MPGGAFPAMIAIFSIFFAGAGGSLAAAAALTGVIILGAALTFLLCRALSATVLKGMPSSFTLELPPYRRPRVGQVVVRSVLDRTLFVLGRAAAVAAPAGLLLWLCAHVTVGGQTLLAAVAAALDPLGGCWGWTGPSSRPSCWGGPPTRSCCPSS